MPTIASAFAEARREKRCLVMPFLTAGDPDLAFTAELLAEAAERGAGLVEVGFPYSDPVADGPVIQASYNRALAAGVRVEGILRMLAEAAPSLPIPLVGMVSYAIVHRHGVQPFVAEARRAGLAGLIVPDLPIEESQRLSAPCEAAGLDLVQLITPTTPRDRARRIAQASRGFIYYVAVAGITGERDALPAELLDNVRWLGEQTELPICIGFGVSRAEHARRLAPAADGLIVGSAVVRRVAECESKPRADVRRDVGAFLAELAAAAR